MMRMSKAAKAKIAVELMRIEIDRHHQRSRFVWRFHLAVWAGFLLATKIVLDLDPAGQAALGDRMSNWGLWTVWRGWPLLIAAAIPLSADYMYLYLFFRRADQHQGLNARVYHRRARRLAGIPGPLSGPETKKHYGTWGQAAEALITAFTAILFWSVTYAATGPVP